MVPMLMLILIIIIRQVGIAQISTKAELEQMPVAPGQRHGVVLWLQLHTVGVPNSVEHLLAHTCRTGLELELRAWG